MAAAPSPHDREAQYQQLLDLLDAPVSGRWVLVQMADVLSRFDLQVPEAESYLLPLVEPLAEIVDDLDPIGCTPQQMETLATALRTAQAHQPALRSLDAAAQAETALRRRAALLYAYGGATARAVACLQPSEAAPIDEADLSASDPRARLAQVRSGTDDATVEAGLEWAAAHWERGEAGAHTTCIPVVERLPSWIRGEAEEGAPVGALRQIGVELYGPSDTTDRLQVDVIVQGADEVDVTAVPLAAARRLLDERFSRLRDQYVQGRLAFDRRHLEHGGRSAGLAIAALFYGAVLDHTRQRRRLQLRSPVTLTGSVTEAGAVEAVEEAVLPAKVRTVFFSPKTTLVVPAAQEDAATAVRDALTSDFPNGDLTIVGADRLEGLFYDRRLTAQRRVGWVRHTARRLWHRRGRVVAGTIIAALLLVIGALLYGPLDKNPVQARFEGETLFVQNAAGRTVEHIDVGQRTVKKKLRGRASDLVEFVDVTGDGQNEIIWSDWPSSQTSGPPQLHCKSVGADTTHWTIPLRFATPFSRKMIKGKKFSPVDLHAGDLDANGTKEVYAVLRHQPYFPSYLMKFNANTGAEQARYVHPGHLRRSPFKVANLDDDPAKELLVGAHSNAFGDAVLIVLDSRRIQGHAPIRGDYAVTGIDPARHEAYLRFPSTVVGQVEPPLHAFVRRTRTNAQTELITAEVQDGRFPEDETVSSYVLVTFTFDFEPVSMGTSSQFDRLAKQLVQQGRLDSVPDANDFERYLQRIQYWTGSGWKTAEKRAP